MLDADPSQQATPTSDPLNPASAAAAPVPAPPVPSSMLYTGVERRHPGDRQLASPYTGPERRRHQNAVPSQLWMETTEAERELERMHHGTPIQCQFCVGQKFRRSRLRSADIRQLLLMRYPVRCTRCSQRQTVSFTVAGISVPSYLRQRDGRPSRSGRPGANSASTPTAAARRSPEAAPSLAPAPAHAEAAPPHQPAKPGA